MISPDYTLFVLGLLSLISLPYFSRMASQVLAGPSRLDSTVFRRGDVIFAIALTIWFLALIASSRGQTSVVNLQVIIAGVVLYTALIISIIAFLIFRGLNPLKVFGLTSAGLPKNFLYGLLWLLLAYPLIMFAQVLSHHLAGPSSNPQEIVTFLMENKGVAARGAVILLAVVVAPLTEELIFRGYLYGVIRKYGGRITAILVSSMLFAAVHTHLPSFAGLFILALILALVYERTGSLWLPIFMHACFNAVSVYIAIFWPNLAQ